MRITEQIDALDTMAVNHAVPDRAQSAGQRSHHAMLCSISTSSAFTAAI